MSGVLRGIILGEALCFGEGVGVMCVRGDGGMFMYGFSSVDRVVVHAELILLWEINRCKSAD